MNYKAPLRLIELKKDFAEDVCSVQNETKHLSSDVIYEILTRVSLGTLLSECRLVCKDWQKIVCDKKFQLVHSQRNPIASGYFIQGYNLSGYFSINFFPYIADHKYSPQIPSPSLDFLPAKDIMIQGASSYGSLLCCVHKSRQIDISTYYICKPATGEWRKIPKPRTRFSQEMIGVVVKQSHPTLHYKILRLSSPKFVRGYHCEIFDSNDWAWKRLKDIKLPNAYITSGCNELVNGGLHWLTSDHQILVFYIDQESWTTFELPHEIENNFRGCKSIIHCDGKIGVFFSTKEWMELWILEDYCMSKPTWKKKYRKDLTVLRDHNSDYASPLDMYSTNIVLLLNDNEFIWYNCDDDTYTTTPKNPWDCVCDDYFAFQSGFNYL